MTQDILIAFDGSAQAKEAVEYARDTFPNATFTLLYVEPDGVPAVDAALFQEAVEEEKAEEALEKERQKLADAGREATTTIIEGGSAHRQIINYATENNMDLIMIGSHGLRKRSGRIFLGSVTQKVVRRSPISVLVVR